MNKITKCLVSLLVACLICCPALGPVVAGADDVFSGVEQKLAEMDGLLVQCAQSGIATDYETVARTVIADFITYGREEIAAGDGGRTNDTVRILDGLADDAIAALGAYLSGEKQPLPVNRYVTSETPMQIVGDTLYADVQDSQTGAVAREPVILTGYGHFGSVIRDIEKMKALGASLIQVGIGPDSVIVDPATSFAGNWRVLKQGGVDADCAVEEDGASHVLRVTNRSALQSGRYVQINQYITPAPNTQYTVSFDAKATAPCYFRPLGWEDASIQVNVEPSDTFQHYSAQFTTSATQTGTDMFFVLENAGEVMIDNVSIQAGGEELVLNGDFETALTVENGLGIDPLAVRPLQDILARAEAADVAVCVLLSPHYFPNFVLEENGGALKHSQEGALEHSTYDVYAPRAKEVLDKYLAVVIPQIKDYHSLHSLCLSNEPTFNTLLDGDKYLPAFQAFLEETYGTVQALNEAYGAEYGAFSDVPMPELLEKTPLFYDWTAFNDQKFASWHEELAATIQTMAPDVPLHAKMLEYLPWDGVDSDYFRDFLMIGSDAGQFAQFSAYAGCDAHAYADSAFDLTAKMLYYDYLTTVTGKPIFNSEDHILDEQTADYSDAQRKHAMADLWQGAIHGRSAQTAWVYERGEESGIANSLLYRPDVVAGLGKTALDLSRLSDEVAAMQQVMPSIGILYSAASRTYTENHANALYQSYRAAADVGQRIAVLEEEQIAAGALAGLSLLILPEVGYIAPDALAAIHTFVKAGGKVIAIGDAPLAMDPHKRPNDPALVEGVLAGAQQFRPAYSDREMVAPDADTLYQAIAASCPSAVQVIDRATGQAVRGVEWRYVESGGRRLLNLYNGGDVDKQMDIVIGGKHPVQITNLITDTQQKSVALRAQEVALLEISLETETKIDAPRLEGGKLKISGSTKPDSLVNMVVMLQNAKETAYDSVFALGDMVSNASGRYEITVGVDEARLTGDVTDMTVYVRTAGDEAVQKRNFSYIKSSAVQSAVAFLSDSKTEKDALTAYLMEGKNQSILSMLGLDMQEFQKLDSAQQEHVCSCFYEDAQRIGGDVDGITAAFHRSLALALLGEDAYTVAEVLDRYEALFDLRYEDMTYQQVRADAGRFAFLERFLEAGNAYAAPQDLEAAFTEACALYDVSTASYAQIWERVQKNESVLVLSESASYAYWRGLEGTERTKFNKLVVAEVDQATLLTRDVLLRAMDAAREAYEDQTDPGGEGGYHPGFGGSSGGSSGGGSSGSSQGIVIDRPPEETAPPAGQEAFNDLEHFSWAEDSILQLAEKGIINGYDDGGFHPQATIKREEFVKMLLLAFDIQPMENAACAFADVPEGAWYYPYVATAYQSGIVKGMSQEQFGVGMEITRQDMCVMLRNAMQHVGRMAEKQREMTAFYDDGEIAAYAKDAVYALYEQAVVNGYEDGTFGPAYTATRAEAAVMLGNLLAAN